MEKQIVLYGLGGAEKKYKALAYWAIYDSDISIENIICQAILMKNRNPSIKEIFAIDNRPGLKRDYTYSYTQNSIESCAEFRDQLQRYGLKIL